ncbi:MAG: amidohydrolase family protein [Pseudooceanicola sp.]|nr:amidohydrolase family protein [Pseudooceanicola sp.]
MQRIDMHAHYYGGGLVEFLSGRKQRPFLRDGVMMAMNGPFPFAPDHWDVSVGLERMAAMGLTRRMLTFPGALCVDSLPAGEVAGPIAAFNEHLAGLRGARLTGLAGLPLADMELAARELRRVRRELRLPGVILPSDYFNTVEDARRLGPVLQAASEEGCLVMLHPGPMAGMAPAPLAADFPQYRTSVIQLQAQAAQTALTVVLGGLLEAYPGVRFQVVNLGGTLPFVFERLEAVARHRNPDQPFPTGDLRRIWYDCASLGPRALEAAVKLYGVERIMLGSDFPIFHDDPWEALARAEISDEAREQIAWGTAAALLEGLE